jgi:hypothetical protein
VNGVEKKKIATFAKVFFSFVGKKDIIKNPEATTLFFVVNWRSPLIKDIVFVNLLKHELLA